MRLQELRDVLNRRPFEPFRIVLTDGAAFDVRHPDMCMPGHRAAVIGLPAAGDPEPVFERHVIVDLAHITRIEPLSSTVSGNNSPAA
jgi:hypothetical protein